MTNNQNHEHFGNCECCNKENSPLVNNPYMEEMENVQRECFLCDECYIIYSESV